MIRCDNCAKCKTEHSTARTVDKLQGKLGIDNLNDYLHKKHIEEFKTTTEIG